MNGKRNILHDSTQGGKGTRAKDSAYARSFMLPTGMLGVSNAIAAGDIVMRRMVKRAEFNAQHGPVKVLFKNGVRLETPEIIQPQ